MKTWLLERIIPFCDNILEPRLYDLIKLNKPRLPTYHPNLDPTEFIWADVKLWVASKNTTFKIKDIKQLCQQGFQEYC